MIDNNQQKEKQAKWREIILNIIKEKSNFPKQIQKKEGIVENKKEIKKIKIKKPKTKRNIYKLVVFIFLAIIWFLISFGIGLYKYNWDSETIIKITRIIPYPAIIIKNKEINNYKLIKYSEFQENFKATKLFFQKQKQADSTFQILSDKILKENISEMMIEDYFIFETLKKNRVIIKKEEVDNKIQEIIKQVGSEQQFEKIVKNLYNWDLTQFKEKAIKQMISQEKIEKVIAPKKLREWLNEQLKTIKIYKFI
ncbi:hypothetical protein CVV26_00280 [Candidatus Kuenenbacteria bacterium HGW-Kuenenbacteria-1]|uniref:Uncharacterized protein n=1 Tax=Candidatus Kuenenbacteria bacterium HGW-Kuenenbacteria-1 TaxID=2013812 RepID=A0A2N1UPC7_9BACT|nr:MAG: hypothetical protein CVV26_00280 [Candidatus Kuenenbacteria bacterium HGW-Kuenenbacteria-1]